MPVGMTQVFGPNGTVIPVTVIEAGPCIVTQIKTTAHDGYEAVQLGPERFDFVYARAHHVALAYA